MTSKKSFQQIQAIKKEIDKNRGKDVSFKPNQEIIVKVQQVVEKCQSRIVNFEGVLACTTHLSKKNGPSAIVSAIAKDL